MLCVEASSNEYQQTLCSCLWDTWKKSAIAFVNKAVLWADIVKNGNSRVVFGGSLPY
jgi:hypothetical protein